MRKFRDICFLCTTLWMLNLLCTSGDKVAGATGTGNPPVVFSAMALIADTSAFSQSLQKTLVTTSGRPEYAIIDHTFDTISISDDSNLKLNIESAKLIVEQLQFLTDSDFDPGKNTPNLPGIKYDSNKIIVEGPFTFDVMNGTCEPQIDSIPLPQASYTGIKLLINKVENGNSRLIQNERTAIEITGTFHYKDTLHQFRMHLSVNSLRTYEFEDSVMILSSNHSTLFLLKLQARRWLNSVSLRTCLENENIQFDQSGTLVIDLSTGVGPCKGVEAQIRENILNSGKLEVIKR